MTVGRSRSRVTVRNLATRAPGRTAKLPGGGTTAAARKATQLQVRRDGALAFVSMNATDATLYGLDRSGLREFDSSPAMQLSGLRFDGRLLRWVQAGAAREAVFDAAP